ncbi:hypothetical protein LX77_00032 [Gelidibacter algens]|uniref:Uncharacterized protein n=1 Tax=Gelidibacter algens TaxID=49280 RepID=A0A1A7QUT5_9FLAO|nr:hypothetical protein A9996_15590 [Gelidibacter algens]RAJ27460.1 hypothetical protein LX77_00032 [Gelidibacter algens]
MYASQLEHFFLPIAFIIIKILQTSTKTQKTIVSKRYKAYVHKISRVTFVYNYNDTGSLK